MKVEVQLLSDKGRLVPAAMRRSMRKFTGSLAINEVRDTQLGRSVTVANLLGTDADKMLPQLHDAVVLCVENGRMRIRGFEVLEGTQTGQTWDVKVSSC
jgi:hypothetical protein